MAIEPSVNHPINCGLATSVINNIFSKRTIADRKFDIVAEPRSRATSSDSESIIDVDKNNTTSGIPLRKILRKINASSVTDYIFNINIKSNGYFNNIVLLSDNPTILSNPDTNGIATYGSNGDCIIRAVSEDGETALIKVSTSSISSNTVDVFQSWISGSLAHHCTNQINNLISNKTQLNVFNQTSWFSIPDFVRNNQCWANGIDMSCASPWNNEAGALYAGTLISKRHVMFCEHASFYPKNGRTITFVSPNSEPIVRTIINSQNVLGADIRLALLDSDVPNNISFSKVLPKNWNNYLPRLSFDSTVPVICLNQTERASISALRAVDAIGNTFVNIYPSLYTNYYGRIILYDSGNPCFLVINQEPVLLGVFTGGGAGTGSFVSYYYDEINSVMSSLGGGYQLTPVDLSGFTSYA